MRLRIRDLFRDRERELDEELRFHLEEEATERLAAGMNATDARFAARRELGNVGLVREETRAAWSWTFVEQALQDLRYAVRTVLHSPAFTVLAVLSLALGIGANTAIYSFMDALLMRRLPVAEPGSLVAVNWHMDSKKQVDDSVIHGVSGQIFDDSKLGAVSPIFPYPAFELLRGRNDVMSVLFAYRRARKLNVVAQGEAEQTDGVYVSGEYFGGLGVVPAAGRLIGPDDDRAGASYVAVLSYGFARRKFGDAARAAGQQMIIDNVPFTVAGVAPAEFSGVDPARLPELYLPMHADLAIDPANSRPANPGKQYVDQNYYWAEMMGRLRPGVTMQQAQAQLAPVFDRWVASTAVNDKERKNLPDLILKPAGGGLETLRRRYSQPLYILLGMVGMLLAIACANIANLLLARASARRREMAVRLSMGAGRWRIVRQLLTESVVLAGLGGAAGVLFAVWGMQFLTAMAGEGEGFPLRPELNWHVLAAAAALTLVTGVLFGLAPALQATRVDPIPALKEARVATAGARGRRRFGLSRMLVVSQMAISLLLLVGAALFVRTLGNLHALPMGFAKDNVLVFKVNARQAGHKGAEILTFYSELERRFAAIPGARSAAMANNALIGEGAWGWAVVPAGTPKPEHAPSGHGSGIGETATRVLAASAGFFATMQVPVIAGRGFDGRDRLGAAPAAIVNEAWAKVNLGGRNPVGQQVVSYGPGVKTQQMEIIGLVKNTRYDDITGAFPPIVYLPFEQNLAYPPGEVTYFVRTAGEPGAAASAVREIVRQADARIPVAGMGTQAAAIEREMGAEKLFARLCTVFALLALAIAGVGLYGTTSYAVARRTGEIGIRMALGAQRRAVVWMVLRDVLVLAAAGFAIGVPAAMAGSKLVESMLYGVTAGDATSLGMAAVILMAATVAAGYVPARRASRIDPMSAVRWE